MQGGLNPKAKIKGNSLDYYLEIVKNLKQAFPNLHLHAFSPQEVQFIAREDGLSYEKVIASLQEAGVNSLPENNYRAKITEFILLPFVGQSAPKPLRNRVGRDQPILADTLKLTAVARIYLGNSIKNHQPSWVKLGLQGATEALDWGCNDLGGTLMEEHITTMAGALGGTCLTVEELETAIKSLDRPARQRGTIY